MSARVSRGIVEKGALNVLQCETKLWSEFQPPTRRMVGTRSSTSRQRPGTSNDSGNGHVNSSPTCQNRGCKAQLRPGDIVHGLCKPCKTAREPKFQSLVDNVTGKRKRPGPDSSPTSKFIKPSTEWKAPPVLPYVPAPVKIKINQSRTKPTEPEAEPSEAQSAEEQPSAEVPPKKTPRRAKRATPQDTFPFPIAFYVHPPFPEVQLKEGRRPETQSPSRPNEESPYPAPYYSHPQPPFPLPLGIAHPLHQYPFPFTGTHTATTTPSDPQSISPNILPPYPPTAAPGWMGPPPYPYPYPQYLLQTTSSTTHASPMSSERQENVIPQASSDDREVAGSPSPTEKVVSPSMSPQRSRVDTSEPQEESLTPVSGEDVTNDDDADDDDDGNDNDYVDDTDVKSSLDVQVFANEDDMYAMLKVLHDRFEDVRFVGQYPIEDGGLDPKEVSINE
ncbi:hypothetical protein FRC02_004650 [Tulasnella sp. 418]|nr:hypothetical protein FRC02_004650 [Tulasnella sp. 418]